MKSQQHKAKSACADFKHASLAAHKWGGFVLRMLAQIHLPLSQNKRDSARLSLLFIGVPPSAIAIP
ncbi:MAG: hypothetical protein AABZ78_11320 [Chloroflexota bacterium]